MQGYYPNPPSKTYIPGDSIQNYYWLEDGLNADNYGLTALMAMVGFDSECYGQVDAGTVFLFPGSLTDESPDFAGGNPSINCAQEYPLVRRDQSPALHMQLCKILGQPPETFIGFAVRFPYDGFEGVGYNSTTCNYNWFDARTIPEDYDGYNWQQLIYSTLDIYLGDYSKET